MTDLNADIDPLSPFVILGEITTDIEVLAPPRGQAFLELVGLSGLAIAQPVLATFGDSPDYFVFREASPGDIILFALAVAILPGLLGWLASRLAARYSPLLGGLVHHGAIAVFVALGLLQITAAGDVSLWLGVPLALTAGTVFVLARLRWAGFRSWLRWLAPAPLLFVISFLFLSPVSNLVRGTDVDPADLGTFASGDPPPVIVMVFDEWPLSSIVRTDGSIDTEVAPNVARLAGSATWYRDTTTVANITNYAVPAILTGNMPEQGDRADAASQPENLFTLLAGNYDMEVKESLTRLCPSSLCETGPGGTSPGDRATQLSGLLTEARTVFTDRLMPGPTAVLVTDAYVEPEAAVDKAESDEGSYNLDELLAPRPERLDAFIDAMDPGEDPTLHYVHVLGPHTPHRHTPTGVRYPSDSSLRLITPPDGSPGSDRRGPVDWPARLDRQRLLLEVGYIDRLVGDVLDRLEETGLYDDALVVLTSDHGLGFEPGASARGLGDRPVERAIEPDLLWVPLLIKSPGQTVGAVSDTPARTVDILPTMAGGLGIDLPWEVDGRDLLAVEDSPGQDDQDTRDDSPGDDSPGQDDQEIGGNQETGSDHETRDDADGPREFVRVAGSSFAVFSLDDPVAVRADVDEVFERGTDAQLRASGRDRWWSVGPRPDLVGVEVADLALGPVSPARHRLDDPAAYADVDVTSGEAPLLVSGRIELDGSPRAGTAPVAILVDDVVAAVVPTYDDGAGPGRFAAMVAPRFFDETDGPVRVADVVDQAGTTSLGLIGEA